MMLKMIARRVGVGVVTLWLVTVLLFVGTEILPSDAAQITLGQEVTPESLKALRADLGLDKPALQRYLLWLQDLAALDLGVSFAGRAKASAGTRVEWHLQQALPNTLLLAGIVAAISIPASLVLGLLSAMYPGSWYDRAVTGATLCLVSVPEFFVATFLVLLLSVKLKLLPSIVVVLDWDSTREMWRALAMPTITLCVAFLAQMTRMTRATVLNILSAPYIEMAILKGVPRVRIITRHALFNAIGPIANVIALNIAALLSGVIIVETIFAYPGLGKLVIDAVRLRDMPLLQGCGMIICTTYVALLLLADICSIVSNPRLRHPSY